MLVSALHHPNALSPMLVTLLGIVMLVSELQSQNAIFKSQRDKEKSLLNIQYSLNTKQGYFDRLLLRGLCDNAKRKRQIRR